MDINEMEILLIAVLKELKYSDRSLKIYHKIISQINRYMEDNGYLKYTQDIGEKYLESKQSVLSKKGCECYRSVVSRLNDILANREFNPVHNKLVCLEPPEKFKAHFEGYISNCIKRKMDPGTLENKRRYACYFFEDFDRYDIPMKDITPEIILSIFLGRPDVASYHFASVIKEILRYLYDQGVVNADYSGFIPIYRRRHILPSVYTKEELEKIKKEAISNPITAKRNLAIVTIAYKYALRDGNITGLKFSDIDFENNRIHIVQVKTDIEIHRILFPEVKEALLDYIDNERPESDSPHIFLTSRAPYRKMTTVYQIFGNAIIRAGIPLNGRKRGSHAIRASVSTFMINNGLSYEIVRYVLGHNCEDTVNKYVSLYVNHLRQCALSVHEPAGIFKRFLAGEVTL